MAEAEPVTGAKEAEGEYVSAHPAASADAEARPPKDPRAGAEAPSASTGRAKPPPKWSRPTAPVGPLTPVAKRGLMPQPPPAVEATAAPVAEEEPPSGLQPAPPVVPLVLPTPAAGAQKEMFVAQQGEAVAVARNASQVVQTAEAAVSIPLALSALLPKASNCDLIF